MSDRLYQQKYFCSVCSKQCKDENGYECHLNTPKHIKNISEIMQNPNEHINKISHSFEKGFIEIMKFKYRNVFVSANKVFLDYIKSKNSAHLNATKWGSLTKFIFSMKKKGKFEVDEIEEGKFLIKLIGKEALTLDEVNLKDAEAETKRINEMKDLLNIRETQREREKYISKNKEISNETTSLLSHKREKDSFCDVVSYVDYSNEAAFNIENPWVAKGLLVKISDKEDENNEMNDLTGIILNIDDSDEYFATVNIPSSNKTLLIDQSNLIPIRPSDDNTKSKVMILYGSYKGRPCNIKKVNDALRIILENTNTEVININLDGVCIYKDS